MNKQNKVFQFNTSDKIQIEQSDDNSAQYSENDDDFKKVDSVKDYQSDNNVVQRNKKDA